jgi:uncharacterized heparinase superfamily protein
MKERIAKAYTKMRTTLIKGSPFYGNSLDRRASLFDIKKFIDDPWPGDPQKGKDILNGILRVNNEESFEIDIITEKRTANLIASLYIDKFSWIKDMQAVGGSNTRKYVREAVSKFIDDYRATNRFWLQPGWNVFITSERIVNWMLEYSFFAIGATDKFQKKVLSSITEQFSNIHKLYKAESDPMARLSAMRAILFCLNFMKSNNKSRIKRLVADVEELVLQSFDSSGMYITRNPSCHFQMFKILLEIRFIARNFGISISKEIFNDLLIKMATCIRFFRMGDGTISRSCGNVAPFYSSVNDNEQNIIDTALSFVDIERQASNYHNSIALFDRLNSKNVITIINKEASNKSCQSAEQSDLGINIFDFEASFNRDNLINRADISIISDGHMIKPRQRSSSSSERKDGVSSYEVTSFEPEFQFAIRRELNVQNSKLAVSDFSYTSKNASVIIRISINKNAILEQLNNTSVIIDNGQNRYVFVSDCSAENRKLIVKNGNKVSPQFIGIHYKSFEKSTYQTNWFVEIYK